MTNQQFVEYIAPLIKKIGNEKGYKIVSTTIAQAIIEGNYGKSSLAKDYHNHFGMKCGSGYKGKSVNMKTKEEYTVGTLTTIRDNFRAYDSDEEGIYGYYSFISAKRYSNLKSASNYSEFALRLKNDGYATSSTYVNTLCKCVKSWGLEKYDTGATAVTQNVSYQATTKPELRLGSTGAEVKNLHQKLRALGYGVSADNNVFDATTQLCVINFQKVHGLKVDGIVGNQTRKALNMN